MPVLPSTAYLTVEGTFNETRAIINDMMSGQAGEIFTDNAPFDFPMLNRAAGYLTNELIDHGVKTFIKETVLTPVTPIQTIDPGLQVNISDTGYYDTVINNPQPQIPTDLQVPERLWERQTGSTENWIPMQEVPDGLPSVVQTLRLRMWEWREDGIYMPGATQSEDIRLRYTAEYISFSTVNDVILIRGAQSAMASWLAYVFTLSRGGAAAPDLLTQAQGFTLQMIRRNTRARQGVTITRRPYGGSHAAWK